jgi:signal transduction histidine kinase
MRLLSQERDAAQEEERKHLSRELHDHVAQVLTALRMELGRIDRARAQGDTRIAAAVAEGKNLIDTMFRTVRDLALGLRPSMLDDFGLQAALEWQIRDFMSRYRANVELACNGDFAVLSDRHRTCVYRAIQEALTNCVRHARAFAIKVSVTNYNDTLALSVMDDGIGFDPAQRSGGLGLRGIEERVKELHGIMRVNSAASQGTTLTIELPLAVAEVPVARAAG